MRRVLMLLIVILLANSVLAQESIYNKLLNKTIETIEEEDPFITLRDGDLKTFKIGEEEFKIHLMMISEKDGSVIMKIDGESLPRLREGDLQASSKGIIVGLVKTFITTKKSKPSLAKLVISKKGKSAKEVVEEDKKNVDLQINMVGEEQVREKNITLASTPTITPTPSQPKIQQKEITPAQKQPTPKVIQQKTTQIVKQKSWWKRVAEFFGFS